MWFHEMGVPDTPGRCLPLLPLSRRSRIGCASIAQHAVEESIAANLHKQERWTRWAVGQGRLGGRR